MLKGAAANNATRTESTIHGADHPVYGHPECDSPPARVMDNPTRLQSASTSHLSSIVRLSPDDGGSEAAPRARLRLPALPLLRIERTAG